MPISLAIHGGAGTLLPEEMNPEIEAAFYAGLKEALTAGWEKLKAGASSADAVEASVMALENNHLFNAGCGAVFNYDGFQEMDAAIMLGNGKKAGAVAALRNVKNPIKLARAVMENSPHVMLAGEGALQFAKTQNLEIMHDSYFHDDFRHQQWQRAQKENLIILDQSYAHKMGTVGAVALDEYGNLAAATSTGGMTNKWPGRVGDSPLIGCGTYANEQVAVSCTGHGEFFIRSVVAYDLACLMEYKNLSLKEASDFLVYEKLKNFKAEGGLIAIDKLGNIALPFNSIGMYRASISEKQDAYYGIFR